MKKASGSAGTHQEDIHITAMDRDALIASMLKPYEQMTLSALEKKCRPLIVSIINDFPEPQEQERQLTALMKKILSFPQVASAAAADRVRLCTVLLEEMIRFPMSQAPASAEALMALIPVFDNFIKRVSLQPNELQELEQALRQALRKARARQVAHEIITPLKNNFLPELTQNLSEFIRVVNAYEEKDLTLPERIIFLATLIEKIYEFPCITLASSDDRIAFFSLLMGTMISLNMVTTPDTQGQQLLSSPQAAQKELADFFQRVIAGANLPFAGALQELSQAARINGIRQRVKNQLQPWQGKSVSQLLHILPALMQAINTATTPHTLPVEEGKAFIAAIIASFSSFKKVIAALPEDRIRLFSSLAGSLVHLNLASEPAALKALLLPFGELIERETALNAAFGQTLRQEIARKLDEIIIHSLSTCNAMTPTALARSFPALIRHLYTAADMLITAEKNSLLVVVMKTIAAFPGIVANSSDAKTRLFSALMESMIPLLTVTGTGLQDKTAVSHNQQAWLLFFDGMIEKIAPQQDSATQELRIELERALRHVRIRQSVIHTLTPYSNLAIVDLKAHLPAFITSLDDNISLLSLQERRVLLAAIFTTLISLPNVDDYFSSDRAMLFATLIDEISRLKLMTSPDAAGEQLISASASPQELTAFFQHFIDSIAPTVGPVWKQAFELALRQSVIRKAIRHVFHPFRGRSPAYQQQSLSLLTGNIDALSARPDMTDSRTFFTILAEEITLFIKEVAALSLPALSARAADETELFTTVLIEQLRQLNVVASLAEQGQAMMRTLQDNIEKFLAPRRRYPADHIIILQLHNTDSEDAAVLRQVSKLQQAYPHAITVRYNVTDRLPEVLQGIHPLPPAKIALLVVARTYRDAHTTGRNHNEQAGISQQQLRIAFNALKKPQVNVLSRGSTVHPILMQARTDGVRIVPTSIRSFILDAPRGAQKLPAALPASALTSARIHESVVDSKKEKKHTTTIGRFTVTRIRDSELHPTALAQSISRVVLSTASEHVVALIPVSQQPVPTQLPDSVAHSQYEWTIIIHTGSDAAVLDNLHSLAAKNAGKSLLIQRDRKDELAFNILYGRDNLVQIAAHHRVRYILAGHGDATAGTLDGHHPEQAYLLYQQVRQQFTLPPAARLVLLACGLGNDGSRPGFNNNFALKFARLATTEAPSALSVQAYSKAIFINAAGRRIPADNLDPDGDVLANHRVDYRRPHQVMEVNGIPAPLIELLQELKQADTAGKMPVLLQTHQHLLRQYFPAHDGGIDKTALTVAMQSFTTLQTAVLQARLQASPEALTQLPWAALSQLTTQLWHGHIHPQKLTTAQQALFKRVLGKGLLYGDTVEDVAMALAVRSDAGRLTRQFFQLQALLLNDEMQRIFSSPANTDSKTPLHSAIIVAAKKTTSGSTMTMPADSDSNTVTRGLFTPLSRTLQILGVLSAIKELLTSQFSQGLTPQQKSLLETQHNILITTLATTLGNEATQHLLAFTGRQTQTLNLQMPWLINQAKQLSTNAGRLLAAGSLLHADAVTDAILKGLRAFSMGMNGTFLALGTGLGIYEALHTAMTLEQEEDPQKRMDLHASFALSLAGTAAIFTGPAALPLSMLLLAAGMGYTTFRHYENINRYLTLSPAQAAMVLLLPLGILPDTLKISFEANRARAELSRLQLEQARTVLQEKSLDAVYFTPGSIEPGHKLSGEETQAIYHTIQSSWFAQLVLAATRLFATPTTSPSVDNSRDEIDLNNGQFSSDGIPLASEKMRLLRTRRRKLADPPKGAMPAQQALLFDVNGSHSEQLASFDGTFIRIFDDKGAVKHRVAAQTGRLPRWILSGNLFGDNRDEILLLDPQKDSMTVLALFNGRTRESHWISGVHSEGGDYLRRQKAAAIVSRQQNYDGFSARNADALTAAPLLADIDGDGFDDLLLIHSDGISICYGGWETQQKISWSFFSFHTTALADKSWRYVLSGRQNKDSYADLVAIAADGTVHTLLGSHDRRKKFTVLAGTPNSINAQLLQQKNVAVLLHDMDRDGRSDLVVVHDDNRSTRATVAHAQTQGQFGTFITDAFSVWRDSGWLGLAGHRIIGFKKGSTTLVSMDSSNALYEHIFTRDRVAQVMLGNGDDSFRALSNTSDWRYIIRVAETGKQRHETGTSDDIFWLARAVRDSSGSVLDGQQGQDTLIIAAGSRDESHRVFLGKAGNAGQITTEKSSRQPYFGLVDDSSSSLSSDGIALLNIEHIQGHKNSRDYLTGNEENNWLSGVHASNYDNTLMMEQEKDSAHCECEEDYLDGGDGDNELTLSRGTAVNGSVWQILHCEHDADTEVILKAGSNPEKISQIFLGYRAEQMQRPQRAGNDLLIRLRHNNGTHKTLRLGNLYNNTVALQDRENALTVPGGFVLHTSDGVSLSLPRLPDNRALSDWHSVNVTWNATHHRNWSELTRDQPAQHIEVYQQKKDPVDNRGKIRIYGQGFASSTVILADFMHLTLTDTPYTNRPQGNDKGDILCAFWMKVSEGRDSYHWDGKTRETIIDNYATDGMQDELQLPWIAKNSRLKRQGNNLVISEQATDERRFLIVNFFVTPDYRHLNVRDISGNLCILDMDEHHNAWLASWQLQQAANRSTNRRTLYATTGPLTLDMRTATDWLLTQDYSMHAHRWYGSNHDDVHIFHADNKTLHDARGNDIYRFESGSTRNVISDSTGDDIYRIDAGSGHNVIADSNGRDTLELTGVNQAELQQSRAGSDHLLTWSATGSLKIRNYYLHEDNRVESILLTDAISVMSVADAQINTAAESAHLTVMLPDIVTLSAALPSPAYRP